MKRLRNGLLALTLLPLPLLAINVAPLEPSHKEAPQATAARLIQSGTLARVLSSHYTEVELAKGVYLGANFCLACHKDHQAFTDTQHATFMRRPMTQYTLMPKKGVMADLDKNGKDDFIDGLDFNTISLGLRRLQAERAEAFRQGRDLLLLGQRRQLPDRRDSRRRPRPGAALRDSDPHHRHGHEVHEVPLLRPVRLGSGGARRTPRTPRPPGTTPRCAPKFSVTTTSAQLGAISNYEAACMGCHVTGIRSMSKASTGEWVLKTYPAVLYDIDDPAYLDIDGDGTFDLAGITCESCHGPGSTHVLWAGNPTKIVNPKTMTAKQQLELCEQCHTTMASTPNKYFGFPYKDDSLSGWYPGMGEAVSGFYIDTTAYWPDGKLQKSGRPFGDYHTSLHATNPYHAVTCNSCHDLHNRGENPRQLIESMYDEASKLTLKTSPEDNTLCLGCHATHGPFANITKEMVADPVANEEAIGKVVSAHSHHPYAPERLMGLGRCIGCHMANTGGSHSWRAVSPELTLKFQAQGGQPNSCASGCHNQLVNIFGTGLKTGTAWNTTFDQKLATTLQKYYGPGGIWWDTKGTPMVTTPVVSSH